MYTKQKQIKNDKLLRSLLGTPCWLCGSQCMSAAHHHIRRSYLRLDVPANLSVLCQEDHQMLHGNTGQFDAKWGVAKREYLNTLKDKYTVEGILEEYA